MNVEKQDEAKKQSKLAGWLGARDTLQLVSLIIGLILGSSAVVGGLTSLGVLLAESKFQTRAAAKEAEDRILHQCEERLEVQKTLFMQRDAALTQQLSNMDKQMTESNTRMQSSIDRIINLLLQRGR